MEDALKQIEEKCNLNDIYVRADTEKYYVYKIREDLLDSELIPFLEKFYSLRYSSGSGVDSSKVLDVLKNIDDTKERLELLKEKRFQTYQEGEDFNYCQIGKWPCNEVRYSCSNAILSLDGKIMMECYGSVFNFFRRCIVAQMSDFKLAEALTIWIDG